MQPYSTKPCYCTPHCLCKDTCNYDNWYTKLLTCYLSLVFYLHVHVQVYANLYKKIQLSCGVFYGRVLNALLAFLMEDYKATIHVHVES